MKLIMILVFSFLIFQSANCQSVDELKKTSDSLFDNKNFEKAIILLNKVIALSLNDAESFSIRGLCYLNLEDYSKAKPDLDKSIELEPKHGRFYFRRGIYFNKQSDATNAINDFTKAIEFSENKSEPYFYRADVYNSQKRFDFAFSDYSKAIELDSTNPRIYNDRGLLYKRFEQYEKAIEDYTKCIEIDPEFSICYYNRGRAKAFIGEFAEACSDLQKAVDLGNKGAKDRYNEICQDMQQSIIKFIKKETIGGRLDFKKVLEKEPGGFFLTGSTAYNKDDYALYLWGMKVKSMGLKSCDEGIRIYSEIIGTSLTEPQKSSIKDGFNSN